MAIEKVIFDMDGCLYTHKDPYHYLRDGFYETLLGRAVSSLSITFIADQEDVDIQVARQIYEKAKSDPIGPSIYLSNRYGLNRSEYFDFTWGLISTEGLIDEKDSEMAKLIIEELEKLDISIHLLTAAPRTWMNRVIGELGIYGKFDSQTCAEDFGHKHEAFSELAIVLGNPNTILSVGDEYENDIKPAKFLGMQTYHVTNSNPLINLVDLIKQQLHELA